MRTRKLTIRYDVRGTYYANLMGYVAFVTKNKNDANLANIAFASLDVMNAQDFTVPESTPAFLVGQKPVREVESSRRIVCVIFVSGLRFRSRRCAVARESGLH